MTMMLLTMTKRDANTRRRERRGDERKKKGRKKTHKENREGGDDLRDENENLGRSEAYIYMLPVHSIHVRVSVYVCIYTYINIHIHRLQLGGNSLVNKSKG